MIKNTFFPVYVSELLHTVRSTECLGIYTVPTTVWGRVKAAWY